MDVSHYFDGRFQLEEGGLLKEDGSGVMAGSFDFVFSHFDIFSVFLGGESFDEGVYFEG